jgi:two-component sensor histidine kinase/CheY-like chemotaxis protein
MMGLDMKYRILFAEDVSTDREMTERLLKDSGLQFESECVETEKDFRHALKAFNPTLILSDFRMPSFDGMTALKIALREKPEIPFIILTGSMNEDIAVECMKAGADDYIIKQNLKRLVPAIQSAFQKKASLKAEEEAREKIRDALAEKETLLRELYHRTNNNMQVIRSIISLRASMRDNPEIRAFAEEIEQKITAMALVHQKLYQSKDLSYIYLNEYVQELAGMMLGRNLDELPGVKLDLYLEEVKVLIDSAIPCGLIINELMSNALQHAFSGNMNGYILIRISRDTTGTIELYFADNGKGVTEGFNFRNQNGMGLQIVTELVETQLHGEISCTAEHGLSYTIRFSDNLYAVRV